MFILICSNYPSNSNWGQRIPYTCTEKSILYQFPKPKETWDKGWSL